MWAYLKGIVIGSLVQCCTGPAMGGTVQTLVEPFQAVNTAPSTPQAFPAPAVFPDTVPHALVHGGTRRDQALLFLTSFARFLAQRYQHEQDARVFIRALEDHHPYCGAGDALEMVRRQFQHSAERRSSRSIRAQLGFLTVRSFLPCMRDVALDEVTAQFLTCVEEDQRRTALRAAEVVIDETGGGDGALIIREIYPHFI